MDLMNETVLLAMLLIFLGSFVQTAIGFGLAIVASPLLFIISPDYVPVPITLIGFFISLISALKYRTTIQVGRLKNALIWRIPGSIVGGGLLIWVSTNVLALWLGLLVLFAVVISIFPVRFEPTPTRMSLAGFFSGFFGTSSGIGGPPIALLLQHQEANELRGNLSVFFVFSSFMSLIVQIAIGYMKFYHLQLTLPLIPAAWLGYLFARRFAHSLSKDKIRFLALTLCFLSGLTAIWKGMS
jgi:uncharacterized membrane protein YfcA